ncbi:Zn-dependent hydrolase [Leucobacter weissii]|uniref:Zn-dependent hydrolase n=1 Tax=Leucobacter weissii TaxID=1983706 RepID=A0A939MHP5_9MICO|nr:Zn-dependent hydrolase [Leucobacter weissii]MBO1900938.1 Zn-dependent hydrolase [Leucobacter weissii]
MHHSAGEGEAGSRPARGSGAGVSIDAERLWTTLVDSARFGGTERGGLHRLALDEADAEVRAWLESAAAVAGWPVQRDRIGNQFVVKPGRRADAEAVLIGSHLDSQPLGGRYDGVYGVLAGLEVLRALAEREIEHERPIILANWTNEEGARFSPSMMGSAVFSGSLALDEALARADAGGATVAEALAGVGGVAAPTAERPSVAGIHAAVELHIEQGPELEATGTDIGFVSGVQAIRWIDARVSGESGHAGTTPLGARRDALVAASRIVAEVAGLGETVDPDIRPTVGELVVTPNSRNVIPAHARLGLDLRHPSAGILDRAERTIRQAAARIAADSGTSVEIEVILDQPAVVFDSGVLEAVRSATRSLGLSGADLISRAGHDAMQLAARVPTAMIFIPCAGGISHSEAERITPEWAANGARVLFETVAELSGARR